MKRFLIVLTIVFVVPFLVQAQDLVDALRYSNVQIQGTARAGGMGNAFGALGGDFTSVSINPAGIGLYRSGELSITPVFRQTKVDATYYGSTQNDNNYNFAFNNLSYVTTINTKNPGEMGLINVNIGLGFNRLKDFNSEIFAKGDNVNGSFLDYITSYANADGFDPNGNNNSYMSDYYERLAWNTDLLLYDQNNNEYWHDMQDAGYGQSQQKNISKQGSIDEYSLAVGLNFNYKLYIGGSIGITDLFYKENSQIMEWDKNNNIPYFNDMQFDSYLRTTGTGYNVKLGVIFKPINEIRIGASIHTPTFYNLHDAFDTKMNSSITYADNSTQKYEASPNSISQYDYDLVTPLRATLSGAFIIEKKGLLSLDYELVDYSSAKLRSRFSRASKSMDL